MIRTTTLFSVRNLFCLLLLSCCAPTVAFADLLFNISTTGNADADAGFQRAANYVSSQFDDDVTINLTTGFSDLGANVLGSASSSLVSTSYTNFRNSVVGDQLSTADGVFASNLPGGSSFSVYINETAEAAGASNQTPYVDSTGSNTSTVFLSRANAKALGLISGTNATNDITISFSDQFTWDFDPTDGIDSGAIDFVGVAVHEIMHGMGFISGVDRLDFRDDGIDSDDDTRVFGLDFARHSQDALNAGADLDLTADNRDKFYSIDGGTTAGGGLVGGTNHWSTGVDNGDGRQASHWKDNLGLGILDPTSQPAGTANVVTDLDLQALDIIGWNQVTSVPEPGSLGLLAAVGSVWVLCRRRKQPKQAI